MCSIFIYHYFPDYSLAVGVLRAKRKRANTRQQLFGYVHIIGVNSK